MTGAFDRLLRSPLSLLDPGLAKAATSARNGPAPAGAPLPPLPAGEALLADDAFRGPVDERAAYDRGGPLLLLVDGTASCMLTTRDIIRIGRASGTSEADLAFAGDLQTRHAEIVRDGEDYFLTAIGPVQVNRQSVRRTLLRHGDRVVLAHNVKLTFEKPSVKSETAVLKLSDRCRLPQDVSLVVLLSGTCTIGPQPSAHIRTREGETPVVLFEREGRLHARSNGNETGAQLGRGVPLRPAEPKEFGDVRIAVKPYSVNWKSTA
jgi:hypothetical protein